MSSADEYPDPYVFFFFRFLFFFDYDVPLRSLIRSKPSLAGSMASATTDET